MESWGRKPVSSPFAIHLEIPRKYRDRGILDRPGREMCSFVPSVFPKSKVPYFHFEILFWIWEFRD